MAEMIRSVSDALLVKSSKTRQAWPSARRLTTAAERTSMLDAISDQLNRHRDDLKYDEKQLKRANEWRAEVELDYDYRMTRSSKKHYITRTLFIIMQIIGKLLTN